VPLAVDDALERRRGVELDGGAEALGLGLHATRTGEVALERLRLRSVAVGARLRDRVLEASCVTDTSTSFCSCICSEQSRPPSDTHHSPLPRIWISLCRVCSMLSSSRCSCCRRQPVAFTSARTSRARGRHQGGVAEDALPLAAAAADRLQAETPAGLIFRRRSASRRSVSPSSVDGERGRCPCDRTASSTASAMPGNGRPASWIHRDLEPLLVHEPWSAAWSGCFRSSVRTVASFMPA
jgi:hypothetical protein